ncbi:MAG: hypothetical protein KDD43_07525 [Bdellovibrionales bacterium]|nr:hypothetical protein [Bdellovibrionales bacterium]
MLDRFLANLPKNILATLLIGGGIFLIILLNPPHTVCDSQMDLFRESQKGFVFLDPKDKTIETTDYELLTRQCKVSNSPGGCYELFARLKALVRDLESVPKECKGKAGSDNRVRKTLWESMDLLVRLAWGEKPPTSYYEKFGWLEPPDLLLYCNLKRTTVAIYGKPAWEQFREGLFKSLPGITGLQRTVAWEHMLLSINCDKYQ